MSVTKTALVKSRLFFMLKYNRLMKKIKILTVSFVLFATSFFTTSSVFAVGLPFGGRVVFALPCTCSANLWVYFAPLSPSPPLPPTGALVYSPYLTRLYSYFAIGTPASWELGDYVPGVQACFQYVGTSCVPIPAYGLMGKVGTGLPS